MTACLFLRVKAMSDSQTIRGKGDIEHTLFDAPGAIGTVATSVNLFDVITGYYGNASGAHGFVRTP